jgi:hypothetical protein
LVACACFLPVKAPYQQDITAADCYDSVFSNAKRLERVGVAILVEPTIDRGRKKITPEELRRGRDGAFRPRLSTERKIARRLRAWAERSVRPTALRHWASNEGADNA